MDQHHLSALSSLEAQSHLTDSSLRKQIVSISALVLLVSPVVHAADTKEVYPKSGQTVSRASSLKERAADSQSRIKSLSFGEEINPPATAAQAKASPKPFDVHNPKLAPVDIKKEAVAPLASHVEWHLVKSVNGLRLFAKQDSTGLDSAGDRSACGALNFLASSLISLQNRMSLTTSDPKSISLATPQASPSAAHLSTTQQSGFCTAEISNLLPPNLRTLVDSHTFFDGPNSWTATLLLNKMINTQRVVDDSEFSQLMNSPVCRPLTQKESPATGDIGIVRFHLDDGRYREQAAFVQISPDMVFTKDDSSRSTPYALESMNRFLTTQNLNTMPLRCRDTLGSNNAGCPTELVYKRCASLATYRSEHPLKDVAKSTGAVLEKILAVEKTLEPFTLGKSEMSDDQFENLLNSNNANFDEFSVSSSDLLKHVDPSDTAWMYAAQARSLLVGIATQVAGIAVQKGNDMQGETKLYAHEPWQGVVLNTKLPVGDLGPVTRYLNCAPFARDGACPQAPASK